MGLRLTSIGVMRYKPCDEGPAGGTGSTGTEGYVSDDIMESTTSARFKNSSVLSPSHLSSLLVVHALSTASVLLYLCHASLPEGGTISWSTAETMA